MAVDITPLGFKAPDGNELVRNGDNHIADNARKAEELIADDRGRLGAIEAKNTQQDGRLDAVESVNTGQSGRLDAIEAKNTTQDTDIAAARTGAVADSKAYVDSNFSPIWKPNTQYAAGQRIISPNGDVESAKTAFTSGATYSAANWNPSTQAGRINVLEAEKAKRPPLSNTADLDLITDTGFHPIPFAPVNATTQHYPFAGKGGLIHVQTAANSFYQIWFGGTVAAPTKMFQRYKQEGTLGAWSADLNGWAAADTTILASAKTYADGLNYIKPFLASGTDLDTIKTPGDYPANANIVDGVAQHYPPPYNLRGHLNVKKANTWIFQEFKTAAPTPQIFTRYFNSVAWTAWKEETPDITRTVEGIGFQGIRHQLVRDDQADYYGGPIPTNGATPVALTWDDYPREFRDAVLPLLRARGLPFTIALSSRMYDPAAVGTGGTWESVYNGAAGTTWAEIDGWTVNDKCEVANHGATHQGTSTTAGLYAEIAQGLIDLRAALPSKPIFCWIQPSATYDAGFNVGNSIDSYAKTLAGKYILDYHAIATGTRSINGNIHVQRRGRPVQGLTRSWITSITGINNTKAAITAAQAVKHGIIVGSHASDISGGSVTVAQIEAFLDWIAAEQTAGRIKVMKLSEWALADTGY